MALPHPSELPAASSDLRSKDDHPEDDPFADEHRVTPEEESHLKRPPEPGHESLSQPAELQALMKQRAELLASAKPKVPSAAAVQSEPRVAPNRAVQPEATTSSTAGGGQSLRRDDAARARPTAPGFDDPRPAIERVPSEYYSPRDQEWTRRALPKATDVQGRYILKTAVSRAALQLAGISFREGRDHLLLYDDPGPIGLQDLRAASFAMQNQADWWREEGPDGPAYPYAPTGVEATEAAERRKKIFRSLVRPWKKRTQNTTASGVAGPSGANARPYARHAASVESDSEDDRPAKHVYH